MTCHEFWDRMPELERDPVRLEHEHQCSSCAALLADQRALAAGLRRLAWESRCQHPPVAIEAKLLEAFRRETAARSGSLARPWTAWRVWATKPAGKRSCSSHPTMPPTNTISPRALMPLA